jgi:hypothetical protein
MLRSDFWRLQQPLYVRGRRKRKELKADSQETLLDVSTHTDVE